MLIKMTIFINILKCVNKKFYTNYYIFIFILYNYNSKKINIKYKNHKN